MTDPLLLDDARVSIDDIANKRAMRPRKVIGPYTLTKTLGAGSMGKVKLGIHSSTGEKVAIKLIPKGSKQDNGDPSKEKDEAKEIRTMREAALTLILHQPYICGMKEMIITQNHYYLFYEYVNGGQLLDYIIAHGKMKEKHARKFARQIGSALDYCHRNAVAHRDLKIENILISKSGNIKLIDFGLANLYDNNSLLKTFCGSLYFAAPELLNARPYIGPEVDIWSFGIVIYVLVCGKVPFDDQHMATLHAKIKRGVVDYPMWLSNECKHLLSRMLVVNPALRANLAEILNHPWMVRGYDGSPENYVPSRQPLTLPLEDEVIEMMKGFGLGTAEEIKTKLTEIIQGEEYQSASKAFLATPETKKKVTSWKKLIGGNHNEKEPVQKHPDPTQAFSPITSVYYLTREKLERKRAESVKGSTPSPFSLSETSLPTQLSSKLNLDVPTITQPPKSHLSETSYDADGRGNIKASTVMPIKITHAKPRARVNGTDDILSPVQEDAPPMPLSGKALMQSGQASTQSRLSSSTNPSAGSSMTARRASMFVSSHRKGMSLSLSPTTATTGNSDKMGNVSPLPSAPLSHQFNNTLSRRDSFNEQDYRKHRPRSSIIGSKQGTKQPVLELPQVDEKINSMSISPRGGKLNKYNEDGENDDGTRPLPPLPRMNRKMQEHDENPHIPHGRSFSVAMGSGAAAAVHAAAARAATRSLSLAVNSNAADTDTLGAADFLSPPDEPGRATESNKPVYLKGLFTVQTTSTKPVADIRDNVIKTLDQLGVHWREVKGGFECVHVPSIKLNSVNLSIINSGGNDSISSMAAAAAAATAGTTIHHSGGDSSMRRNLSIRRRSMAPTPTSDEAFETNNMVVRFDINIVKIPWLMGMHGIQFRRVSGDSWSYKRIATSILGQLRL